MSERFSLTESNFLQYTLNHPTHCQSQTLHLKYGQLIIEDAGIFRFEPDEDTAQVSLVLSVGIHGNETGPIELVNQIIMKLVNGNDFRVRLLVLFGNPQAALVGKRFIDVNLNRLFMGAWKKHTGIEVARAAQLESAVSHFFESAPTGHQRLHYDLHTAIRESKFERFAVVPFDHGQGYDRSQWAFLAAAEISALLLSHQATTTFSYYSHRRHGAQAFTIELGKVQPFGENDLSHFNGMKQALEVLIYKGHSVVGDLGHVVYFEVVDALIKDHEDYRLAIENDVKNFTDFHQGFCLAVSPLSDYRVQKTGDAIVFPNTHLPIGQRAGLIVRPVDISKIVFSSEIQ